MAKSIAVVGASGVVGEEILLVMQELGLMPSELFLISSPRTAGEKREFAGKKYTLLELKPGLLKELKADIVFLCAGGAVSEKYAQEAIDAGSLVIDNSSFFRMHETVPLVVPECNLDDVKKHQGLIANPNCSSIQMAQVLAPLDKEFDLLRADVATYQAASGAGKDGMEELVTSLQSFFAFNLSEFAPKAFAYPLALNLIPQIDVFMPSGFTKEEEKMIYEVQKIMHKQIPIAATCVRVPVLRSHSEALTLKFARPVSADEARAVLKCAAGVIVVDDKEALTANDERYVIKGDFKDRVEAHRYPMPLFVADTNYTYVGRIRSDVYDPSILHLWCVADQIRVGAATNAVRIALAAIDEGVVGKGSGK